MKAVKPSLKQRKREAILDAAVREFGTCGFDNTTMDRIAEVANVSKRTVYNHFPSKEDLFKAIVDRLNARCGSGEDLPFDEQIPLERQLLEIGQRYAALIASEDFKDLARVILPRFLQSPTLSEQLVGDTTPIERSFIQWIQAAQRAGQLKQADPSLAARQFLAMINAFVFWPQILSGKLPVARRQQAVIVQSAANLFLAHYAKVPSHDSIHLQIDSDG